MSGIEEWILLATAHIAFPPDRKPVAEEIRASYEDHRDALIEAGESSDRAAYLALQAMGDPNEAGELLAKVHKPWLGWAWKVSRWVMAAACILLFIGILRLMWGDLPGFTYQGYYTPEPVLQAETEDGPFVLVCRSTGVNVVKAGAYTFQVKDAQILQYKDGGECAFLLLNVRYPFWLNPPYGLEYKLSAEDSAGTVFVKSLESEGGIVMPSWQTEDPHVWMFDYSKRPGESRYWVTLLGFQGIPEWVALKYDHGGLSFSLAVQFEENKN